MAIGGPDFNQYVMLEIHYNNQDRRKGIRDYNYTLFMVLMAIFYFTGMKDRSGMRLKTTKHLRPNDAGIIELGLIYSDKMAIPPFTKSFKLTGYCVAECSMQVSYWCSH